VRAAYSRDPEDTHPSDCRLQCQRPHRRLTRSTGAEPVRGAVFRAHVRGGSPNSHPRRVGPATTGLATGRPLRAPQPADLCAASLRSRGGGWLGAPGEWLRDAKGEYPVRPPYLRLVYTNGYARRRPHLVDHSARSRRPPQTGFVDR
jgi:hypothetical protein